MVQSLSTSTSKLLGPNLNMRMLSPKPCLHPTANNILLITTGNLVPRRTMWAFSMLEYPAAASSLAPAHPMTSATTSCVTTSTTSTGMRTKRMPRLLLTWPLVLLSILTACLHETPRARTPGLPVASRAVSEIGQLESRLPRRTRAVVASSLLSRVICLESTIAMQ